MADSVPEVCAKAPAKVRKARGKKGDLKLQKRLEPYSTSDPLCPNAWLAYSKEKKELAAEEKAEREREKKDGKPPVEQIRATLSYASRLQHWASVLKSLGRIDEAAEVERLIANAMEEAGEAYKDPAFTVEDHALLDEKEVSFISKPEVPPFPYLCTKSDLRELELHINEARVADLERRLKEYAGALAAGEGVTQQLLDDVAKTLPAIADPNRAAQWRAHLAKLAGQVAP